MKKKESRRRYLLKVVETIQPVSQSVIHEWDVSEHREEENQAKQVELEI